MRQIRQTLRLHLEAGLSYAQVSAALGIAKSTVGSMVLMARAAGVDWAIVVTSRHKSARGSRHIPARAAVAEKRPEGVAFSRSFCRRFRGPIGDLLRCRSDLWIAVGRAVEFEAV